MTGRHADGETERTCSHLACSYDLHSAGPRLHRSTNDQIAIEQTILDDQCVHEIYLDSVIEGCCNGSDCQTRELIVLSRPWGFVLESIPAPIYLWHGEADGRVPALMSHHIAAWIRDCGQRSSLAPGICSASRIGQP